MNEWRASEGQTANPHSPSAKLHVFSERPQQEPGGCWAFIPPAGLQVHAGLGTVGLPLAPRCSWLT